MYDRRIADRELTFGVSGKLHANSLIMYDHQTDSLWSHLVGAAVTGPLKGAKLLPLHSILTKWEVWRNFHPTSKVLSSGRSALFGLSRDPYESYYRSPDTGIIATRVTDKRIYPKEYVLGIVLNDRARAYPFSALSREPVVNDSFQGVPLLVVFDPESTTGAIFRRKTQGKTPAFKKAHAADKKRFFLTDDATSSLWEGLTGIALQGPLKGKKLERLPMTPSFWFGWVDHYPNTELFVLKK